MSLGVLDHNLLRLILDWLDLVSLGRASRTCRVFNQVAIGRNFLLWKKYARFYMKNDVYNWKTLVRADRIERSMIMMGKKKRPKQFFGSLRYGGLTVYAYNEGDNCRIYADNLDIISWLVKQHNASKGYNGDAYIEQRHDVCGMFADLITNYGFFQIFK